MIDGMKPRIYIRGSAWGGPVATDNSLWDRSYRASGAGLAYDDRKSMESHNRLEV